LLPSIAFGAGLPSSEDAVAVPVRARSTSGFVLSLIASVHSEYPQPVARRRPWIRTYRLVCLAISTVCAALLVAGSTLIGRS
jgi:hypothetical protein